MMRLFGWGDRGNPRERLLRKLPRDAVCAEIGVFRGDFSEQILLIARPRRLHLIDSWKFEPGETHAEALYGIESGGGQPSLDSIHSSVRERFDHEIQVGTVVINRAASAEAVAAFADGYFDWIYFYGSHLYELVLRDLESYYPKVKPGGLIAGGCYGVAGGWNDGVARAVNEFAVRGGCTKKLAGGQFLLRRPTR